MTGVELVCWQSRCRHEGTCWGVVVRVGDWLPGACFVGLDWEAWKVTTAGRRRLPWLGFGESGWLPEPGYGVTVISLAMFDALDILLLNYG